MLHTHRCNTWTTTAGKTNVFKKATTLVSHLHHGVGKPCHDYCITLTVHDGAPRQGATLAGGLAPGRERPLCACRRAQDGRRLLLRKDADP
jgi:hypothetical protein